MVYKDKIFCNFKNSLILAFLTLTANYTITVALNIYRCLGQPDRDYGSDSEF